jgi:hypothetical protein
VIQKARTQTFTCDHFNEYQLIVEKAFFQAAWFYKSTIVWHIIFLCLINIPMLIIWLKNTICLFMIAPEILNIVITITSEMDPKAGLPFILFLLLIIALFYNNMPNCDHVKIFSLYRITHVSFFLSMLYYKYGKFKKVMKDFKKDHEIT